jgi:hypothetical protein
MERGPTAASSAAARASGATRRVAGAWRGLGSDQRTAAAAALSLFVAMFLPWYQETGSAVVDKRLAKVSDDLSAFQVFTFIEASVLLVAVGILVMLFARGEGRAFHLPGGDGTIVLGGGIWVCLLIFIRQLDKPAGHGSSQFATTIGVQWGIFIAFLAGLGLAFAGWRIRAAHRAEPPLPGEAPTRAVPPDAARTEVAPRPRRRPPPPDDPMEGQLTFDD